MYRDILYVLDRGHSLQAPCGESGSDCGFSAGFTGLQVHDSRRSSRGNVGIPAGISKGCGKGGKPALWLSILSIPRHFHGLFLTKMGLCSFDLRDGDLHLGASRRLTVTRVSNVGMNYTRTQGTRWQRHRDALRPTSRVPRHWLNSHLTKLSQVCVLPMTINTGRDDKSARPPQANPGCRRRCSTVS